MCVSLDETLVWVEIGTFILLVVHSTVEGEGGYYYATDKYISPLTTVPVV